MCKKLFCIQKMFTNEYDRAGEMAQSFKAPAVLAEFSSQNPHQEAS